MERASPPCNFLGNKMKRQKSERFSIVFVTFTAIQDSPMRRQMTDDEPPVFGGKQLKIETGAKFDVTTSSGGPFFASCSTGAARKNAASEQKTENGRMCDTHSPIQLKVEGQGGEPERESSRPSSPDFYIFGSRGGSRRLATVTLLSGKDNEFLL